MSAVTEKFGNKVRIRVSGLCYKEDKILLLKHDMGDYKLWAPPGGGVNFGENLEQALVREFKEETSLDISPGEFLFFTEYIQEPLHAVELFYKIESYKGKIAIGNEPEINNVTILEDMDFFSKEMLNLVPECELHSLLKGIQNPLELLKFRGYKK